MCVQVNFCDGGRMVFLIFHLRKKSTEKLLSPTDMSRNVGTTIAPETGVNGTYSTRLFAKEAIAVLKKHFMPRQSKQEQPPPLYMYVAPQNVFFGWQHFSNAPKAWSVEQHHYNFYK